MPNLLEDELKSYLADVVPKDAGAVQRHETMLAFMAGATSAVALIFQAGKIDPVIGAQVVDGLRTELIDFAALMQGLKE